MSVFWATIIGAVIGAVGAIAGGFAAAWWQTSRADDIAQKIRRAERREEALLALRTKTTEQPGNVSLEARTFEDLGDGRTLMRQHAVFPTVPARDHAIASGMRAGINDSMDRLGELLERSPQWQR